MANPYQGGDVDPFSGARDEEGNIKRPAARKKSFKEAFAEARRMGDGTFMWNGKKYTTELAKPKAKDIGPGSKVGMGRIEDTVSDQDRKVEAAKKAMNEYQSQEGRFGPFKKGGKVVSKAKKYAGGGSVGSASKRADGCATRGRTKGRMV